MASNRINIIKNIVDRRTYKPDRATIVRIDDDVVDIKISGSSNYVRNVPVRGSTSTLSVGNIVPIIWSSNRPVVIADGSSYSYIDDAVTDSAVSSGGGSLSGGIVVVPASGLIQSFDASVLGFGLALASSPYGSTVYVPGMTYSGTVRIPSGVSIIGSGKDTEINGPIYLASNSSIENIYVNCESISVDWVISVYGPSSSVAVVKHCWITAVNTDASGGAIGVSAERFGDIEIHDSIIAAHCDGTLGGYGIHSSAGRILMLGGTCYGTTAPTKTMVW